MRTLSQILRLLVLVVTSFVTNVLAQEVAIPDARLNAAIRDALRKPSGPLTEQDMLSLTNLDAPGICLRPSEGGCQAWDAVKSLEGLGAAHNLITLDLNNNQLTNLTLPAGLMNLTSLNLEFNQL